MKSGDICNGTFTHLLKHIAIFLADNSATMFYMYNAIGH